MNLFAPHVCLVNICSEQLPSRSSFRHNSPRASDERPPAGPYGIQTFPISKKKLKNRESLILWGSVLLPPASRSAAPAGEPGAALPVAAAQRWRLRPAEGGVRHLRRPRPRRERFVPEQSPPGLARVQPHRPAAGCSSLGERREEVEKWPGVSHSTAAPLSPPPVNFCSIAAANLSLG